MDAFSLAFRVLGNACIFVILRRCDTWCGSPVKGPTIRKIIDGKRSEEHTSELQSRFDLVCRLLLEKKKGSGAGAKARRGLRPGAARCARCRPSARRAPTCGV